MRMGNSHLKSSVQATPLRGYLGSIGLSKIFLSPWVEIKILSLVVPLFRFMLIK